MESDRVLVMDDGRVSENDCPATLLASNSSALTGMVAQTGDSSARYLKDLANNAAAGRAARRDAASVAAIKEASSKENLSALADSTSGSDA